jgi:hypothetical protein
MEEEQATAVVLVSQQILHLRGQRIIVDKDLADLYGVTTKALLQALRRNRARFPDDFVFQINDIEWTNLRSQFVTSSSWGGRRHLPWAFTEHGALQVANVLKSGRAVAVSLLVVRAFVRLRQLAESNRELAERLNELESKYSDHDVAIRNILASLRQLVAQPDPVHRPIGFTADLG